MKKWKSVRVLVPVVAGLCALGATVAWAQSSIKLVINGNPITTSVRTINGQKYVPLSAVAKALKMNVYTKGSQITLRPAGGTYQIANKLTGVEGEDLFSGQWGFKVLSVERTKNFEYQYKHRFLYEGNYKKEAKGNEEFVIVRCQIKNGTKVRDEFTFSPGEYGENTSLTDINGQSYQPFDYDVMADENAPYGRWALPGAQIPFSIVFRVPQDTQLKDLVFTVVRYKERGDNRGTDFRVALKG